MRTITPPLKWHGGKHYLAKQILTLRARTPHLHFVESHFGGGAVLLAADPNQNWMHGAKLAAAEKGCSEVVNDIDENLTNFWRCLKHPELFAEFQRQVACIPFSQVEYEASQVLSGANPVGRAVAFFVHCRQSMSGRMDSFAPLSRNRTRGGINEQANAWLNCIDGLPEVHQRLISVVILNMDAVACIRQQDGENTLFYVDPPYLKETRTAPEVYAHEMTEAQHVELLDTLAQITGKFILSGYRSTLYDAHANKHGWKCQEIEIDNKSGKSGRRAETAAY